MLKQSPRALFLLAVLFSPALIGFFAIQMERNAIRREVKHQMLQGIDKDRLELISVGREESSKLRWVHSKEFEFLGEMYDVVYKKTSKDSIHYWCWWDHQETTLNKELNTLLNRTRNQSNSHKTHVQLIVFFKSLYSERMSKWEVEPACAAIPGYTDHYSDSYKSRTPQVIAPPPQA